MEFFTADWLLTDARAKLNNDVMYDRPFYDIKEQNDVILKQTNDICGPEDHLYFIGNFVRGWSADDLYVRTVRYFRDKLRCRYMTLIYGNQDARGKKYDEFRLLFTRAYEYREVLIRDTSLVLSHYPFVEGTWNRYKEGALHLHGHTHGMLASGVNRVDIGIDNAWKVLGTAEKARESYRPLSLDEIRRYALGR